VTENATGTDVRAERVAISTTLQRARGHWIDDWRPEDMASWNSGGKAVATRNLIFSVTSEHIGFSIWSLWSVFVLFMGPQ
jgi:NNP family nitrate/nitrite transporter-like MFS transporter